MKGKGGAGIIADDETGTHAAMSRNGAAGGLQGSLTWACRRRVAVTRNEVPVPADLGCPDGEAPGVERGEEEQARDEVRQAGVSAARAALRSGQQRTMQTHNLPMDTSAKGGFTIGFFRGTFLVFPLRELLLVSGERQGMNRP
jgi:hypothetical protein